MDRVVKLGQSPKGPAFALLAEMEGDLDRVKQLTQAALMIIEHEMGRTSPGNELTTLLTVLDETVENLENRWREASVPRIDPPNS